MTNYESRQNLYNAWLEAYLSSDITETCRAVKLADAFYLKHNEIMWDYHLRHVQMYQRVQVQNFAYCIDGCS